MLSGARQARREAGFTLVELLISIAILGLIMTALTAIILASLAAAKETEDRLDATNAVRRLTNVFERDVASAVELRTGVSATCGSGTALIDLRGRTFDPPAVAVPAPEATRYVTRVSYVVGTTTLEGSTVYTLTRRECRGPAPSGPVTVESTIEVASPLSAAPTVAVSGVFATLTVTGPDGETQTLTGARRTS